MGLDSFFLDDIDEIYLRGLSCRSSDVFIFYNYYHQQLLYTFYLISDVNEKSGKIILKSFVVCFDR